ncbi:ABC transporter ATP-binding protein [Companilactobacillus halodurans]|uniref:ABC-type quaternary amine transporter n=1 Tax=Companilactobacillus halodurans TaxID=2584183 RepID=A0A5P0ZXJ1_9LACO|nr:ABC transporter ATP-binding protein [Companilactobacillus halodurans]MQS97687.1 ABC transporter ATP-binding protein [Companilactobacillus halodurans]
MAQIKISDLSLSYQKNKQVLKNLSLEIKDVELLSILGPSGCGKTTMLRLISGLLPMQTGSIKVSDKDISKVPVYKRNFGMVFQSYALFPHMTIFQNVAFGLKRKKLSKAEISEKTLSILQTTGLAELKDRMPNELSGGQQQRVSLARALAINPDVLLLDEPLSNLDAKLRIEMREEISRLQKKLSMTTIFVTHDQEECFAISDRVAVMNQGKIEQLDTPQTIYQHPRTKFVAEFIGYENFIPKKWAQENNWNYNDVIAGTYLTIRPENITLGQGENSLLGKVIAKNFLGNYYQYIVETPLGRMKIDTENDQYVNDSQIALNFEKSSLIELEDK